MYAVRFVLTAVICLAVECANQRATDKPGLCPPIRWNCAPQDGGCTNDAFCDGGKKCCQLDCGQRRCVEPKFEKPGVCPKFPDGLVSNCNVTCENDLSCDGTKKCCLWGCGKECKKPREPEFSCPDLNFVVHCFYPPHDYCADMGGCREGTQCCVTRICNDTTCFKSFEEKDAFCPYYDRTDVLCPDPPRSDYCQRDVDCAGMAKCCPNVCGSRQCTPSVRKEGDKLGYCRNEIVTECYGLQNTCSEDKDCARELKCCGVICGDTVFTQCKDPGIF